MNPGLLDHWQTLYPLGQRAGLTCTISVSWNRETNSMCNCPSSIQFYCSLGQYQYLQKEKSAAWATVSHPFSSHSDPDAYPLVSWDKRTPSFLFNLKWINRSRLFCSWSFLKIKKIFFKSVKRAYRCLFFFNKTF